MISYKGFNEGVLTFKDTNTRVGYPVSVTEGEESREAINGNDFIGVCVGKAGDYITVQLSGYAEMKYTGSAPVRGYTMLVSNGSGGVKTTSSAAHSYKVIKVDTDNNIVGFIL